MPVPAPSQSRPPHPAADPSAVAWHTVALRLAGADPHLVPDGNAVRSHLSRFSRLPELVAEPGRYALGLHMAVDGGTLDCRLLLTAGAPTLADAEAEAGHLVDAAVSLLTAPAAVWDVEVCEPPAPDPALTDGLRIRQGTVTVSDGDDSAYVLSRFEHPATPWTDLVDVLATASRAGTRLVVRVSLLPATLTVDDVADLERNHAACVRIAGRNVGTPTGNRGRRGVATITDLHESFASPVMVADVAVLSDRPVRNAVVRTVAAAFTSERDVVSASERGDLASATVAARTRLVGGYDTTAMSPDEIAHLQATHLPAVGAVTRRTVADLVTVTEAAFLVRWPLPAGAPLPGVRPTGAAKPVLGPELAVGLPIGIDASGRVVHLPLDGFRHVHVSGPTGAGKSVLLAAIVVAAVAAGWRVIVYDGHETLAHQLHQKAVADGYRSALVDGRHTSLAVLRHDDGTDPARAEQDRREIVHAIKSSWPPDYVGPRGIDGLDKILALGARVPLFHPFIHPAELNDEEVVRSLGRATGVTHPANALVRILRDAQDTIGWLIAKFSAVGGPAARLFAPVGEGTHADDLVADHDLIVVPLGGAGVTETDAVLASNMAAGALQPAIMRADDGRPTLEIYDEGPRFAAHHVENGVTEGRKFRYAVVYTNQHAGQLPQRTTDALRDNAAVRIAFGTRADADRVAVDVGVAPSTVRSLPRHTALVRAPGPDGDVTTTVTPTLPDLPEPVIDRTPHEPLPTLAELVAVLGQPGDRPPEAPDGQSFLDGWLARRRAPAAAALAGSVDGPFDDDDHEDAVRHRALMAAIEQAEADSWDDDTDDTTDDDWTDLR